MQTESMAKPEGSHISKLLIDTLCCQQKVLEDKEGQRRVDDTCMGHTVVG